MDNMGHLRQVNNMLLNMTAAAITYVYMNMSIKHLAFITERYLLTADINCKSGRTLIVYMHVFINKMLMLDMCKSLKINNFVINLKLFLSKLSSSKMNTYAGVASKWGWNSLLKAKILKDASLTVLYKVTELLFIILPICAHNIKNILFNLSVCKFTQALNL